MRRNNTLVVIIEEISYGLQSYKVLGQKTEIVCPINHMFVFIEIYSYEKVDDIAAYLRLYPQYRWKKLGFKVLISGSIYLNRKKMLYIQSKYSERKHNSLTIFFIVSCRLWKILFNRRRNMVRIYKFPYHL